MHRDKLLPLSVPFLGAGGYFLNHQIHETAIVSDTKLLDTTSPYPGMLLAVTALVVVVMLLGVLKGTSPQGGEANLGNPSMLALALWRLGASAVSVAAGGTLGRCLILVGQWSDGDGTPFPLVPIVGAVMCAAGGIGILTMAKYLAQGECPPKLGTMTTLMAFAPLPWLLHCYQENTINPSITLYGYQLLGLILASLATYLVATFFYGKSYPKLAAALSLIGAYFLIASMGTHLPYYFNMTQAALAIVLLGNASAILKNINIAPQIGNEQEGID